MISLPPRLGRFLALSLFGAALARADVTVPALFSDHAVLQKAARVPVWGKADPGENVTVTLDKSTAKTTAGTDGKWRAILDLHAEGPGPYTLVVQGKDKLSFSDIVLGEVWLCGGQSNMEMPVHVFPFAKDEVPKSANPLLRRFKVRFHPSATPLDDVDGKWELAGPDTIPQWTAVGYLYGKKLQTTLGVPVGLLEDCVGGTMIEAWMSDDALATDPALKADAQKAQHDSVAFAEYGRQYDAWLRQFQRGDDSPADPALFAAPGVDTHDWKTVNLPGRFSAAGLPGAGAIWIRRTFPVPGSGDLKPGKAVDLYLGDVHDSDTVYWNGHKVGSSSVTATNHRYAVRPNLVTQGDNTLAIRVFDPGTDAGIFHGKGLIEGRFQASHYMLKGPWLAKVEKALPPLDAAARAALPAKPETPYGPQNVAAYLFNGMIHPVIPYAIRGVIWYQGEGNWNHGYLYRTEFPALIRDWRSKWGEGNFPFYFCQIANNHAHPTVPGDDPAAELREAQTMALSEPNTGEAILIDLGEENNIHPADKMDVADRLARIAFNHIYGRPMVDSGPVYQSMDVEGGKIRLHFKSTDGGLVARPLPATYQLSWMDPTLHPVVRNSPDSQLEGFAICGEDHHWQWASAKIDGNTVLVWNPQVPKPVAVRYAWAFNPWCNLYNGAELPAGPFRTDDFPGGSFNARYGNPAQ